MQLQTVSLMFVILEHTIPAVFIALLGHAIPVVVVVALILLVFGTEQKERFGLLLLAALRDH
jgi:hypothetical protein